MSLMKNNNNSGSVAYKRSYNFTAQVADLLLSINKKNRSKPKTSKLIKTLNNQDNNSNCMTEDDIDKLFGRPKTANKLISHAKISTEAIQQIIQINHKNLTKSVKFLRLEDEFDKFLTGLPRRRDQDLIQDLFNKNAKEQYIDLTSEFKKHYLVGKIIGQGAYASVRVAIFKPEDKKIAIKIYQKAKLNELQRKKSVKRQIRILQILNHPNIVKIIDVVQTNNHLNIIMEYLGGTSLATYLKSQPSGKIPQKNCKKVFKSLAKALKYMHSLNIAHRDIKLENIILDQSLNPKIIDFGFSTCIESEKKIKLFCGTPSYMAPQVVQRKEYRGENADIWALGVMLFVSLTGMFPFKGSSDQELYKKINSSDYPKAEILYNRALTDLMSKMLKVNPQERISANEILKHPWLNESKTESSQKKHSQLSQQIRKRVNTINQSSKEKKWAHQTGLVKKVLLDTGGKDNLQRQIRLALQSPKMKRIDKQINSYRFNQKQNELRSQKQTHRGKQTSQIKQKSKPHTKVIDLLKTQIKKKQSEKSKSKKKG